MQCTRRFVIRFTGTLGQQVYLPLADSAEPHRVAAENGCLGWYGSSYGYGLFNNAGSLPML